MPKPRASRLESATARRKLTVQKKPFWLIVSPNIGLGYRRNEGAGTCGLEAKTIHRLLEVDPKGGGFKRAAAKPAGLTAVRHGKLSHGRGGLSAGSASAAKARWS